MTEEDDIFSTSLEAGEPLFSAAGLSSADGPSYTTGNGTKTQLPDRELTRTTTLSQARAGRFVLPIAEGMGQV